MSKTNPIGLPANSWNYRHSTSKCLHGVNIVSKSRLEVLQGHLYILNTIQNSGVTVEVESMQFSTSKDTNPILGSMAYYGFIEEIWKVDYIKFFVPVFKCKWVDNKSEVKIDES